MPLIPSSRQASRARAPNKWQEYRDAVLAAIQLSHDLKIIEQFEALQTFSSGRTPFTSKRQPTSRTPRVFAPSELEDGSDAESDAEAERDVEKDNDEYLPNTVPSPRRQPALRAYAAFDARAFVLTLLCRNVAINRSRTHPRQFGARNGGARGDWPAHALVQAPQPRNLTGAAVRGRRANERRRGRSRGTVGCGGR